MKTKDNMRSNDFDAKESTVLLQEEGSQKVTDVFKENDFTLLQQEKRTLSRATKISIFLAIATVLTSAVILDVKLSGRSLYEESPSPIIDEELNDKELFTVANYNVDTRRYNEMTYLSAHNAFALSNDSFDYSAQLMSIYDLLKFGVRGLNLEIRMNFGGELCLMHERDFFLTFRDGMEEVLKYLEEDLSAIIQFDLEVDENVLPDSLDRALGNLPPLLQLMFDYNDWTEYDEWPTPSQMIDRNQRVVMVIDNIDFARKYRNKYIMFRDDVTTENMYGVVDPNSCDERFGYPDEGKGEKFAKVKLPNNNKWSRLITMNHFRAVPRKQTAWNSVSDPGYTRGEENDWDNLYKHVETCMKYFNRNPTFLSIDWVGGQVSDALEITEFFNDGGIIFYEGNHAEQDIVCALSGKITEAFNAGNYNNFGCKNDETRSATIFNTRKGTAFAVYDNSNLSMEDDFAVIEVTKDIGYAGCTVNTFQSSSTYNCGVRVTYYRNNGLDGKVSAWYIQPNGVRDIIGNGLILFYEGNNGSQNLVCTLKVKRDRINFKKDSYGCDNDEARSLVLSYVKAGTTITIYDSPDAKTNDDYTVITVKRSIPYYRVNSFQGNINNDYLKATYHRKNGLDGKVSYVKIDIS